MIERALDIAGGATALLLLAPLLVVALGMRCGLGRPVLFTQLRTGRGGRPFRLVKLRTMRDIRDAEGRLLPDADRVTRFGRFLRSTSLDELPELWNVLKGETSLVGPRPLLLDYLALYTVEQARRHEMRPGITGLAQVDERNALRWEEKFRLDVWYVDHASIWLDIKILWLTLRKVFRREGISQEGQAILPRERPLTPAAGRRRALPRRAAAGPETRVVTPPWRGYKICAPRLTHSPTTDSPS